MPWVYVIPRDAFASAKLKGALSYWTRILLWSSIVRVSNIQTEHHFNGTIFIFSDKIASKNQNNCPKSFFIFIKFKPVSMMPYQLIYALKVLCANADNISLRWDNITTSRLISILNLHPKPFKMVVERVEINSKTYFSYFSKRFSKRVLDCIHMRWSSLTKIIPSWALVVKSAPPMFFQISFWKNRKAPRHLPGEYIYIAPPGAACVCLG